MQGRPKKFKKGSIKISIRVDKYIDDERDKNTTKSDYYLSLIRRSYNMLKSQKNIYKNNTFIISLEQKKSINFFYELFALLFKSGKLNDEFKKNGDTIIKQATLLKEVIDNVWR